MIMTSRTVASHKGLLEKLGIKDVNSGASHGPHGWIGGEDGERIVSTNPATGDPLGAVTLTTDAGYEQVVTAATRAFTSWRERPGLPRGGRRAPGCATHRNGAGPAGTRKGRNL